MKTAFVFDTKLLKKENGDYYAMTLTNDFFNNRYSMFCENLVVVTREKKIKEENGNISGYKKTNGNFVNVKTITKYKEVTDSIKNRNKIQSEMDSIIENVDNLIIRMPSVLGMFACKSADKFNKPYIIEMVACAWDGYTNHVRFGGKIIAPFMYFETRKCIKKSKNVIYVTEKFLQNRYPNTNNNLGCSDVVLKKIDSKILENKLSKIKNNKSDILKMVTVASVEAKYKGQEFVIKALAELKKKNIKCEYYLIGNGNNTRLKLIAEKYDLVDEIKFLGSLTHDDVFDKLKEMDLYIQPSLQEGLPRALVEAMSMALPAIGFNTGGIPELLKEKCILKKRDYKSLSNLIEVIDSEFLSNEAVNNFNTAKLYSSEYLDNKREDFYINALNKGMQNEKK
ncbi:MAG: glycosyltransferase [bacterium]